MDDEGAASAAAFGAGGGVVVVHRGITRKKSNSGSLEHFFAVGDADGLASGNASFAVVERDGLLRGSIEVLDGGSFTHSKYVCEVTDSKNGTARGSQFPCRSHAKKYDVGLCYLIFMVLLSVGVARSLVPARMGQGEGEKLAQS